MKRFLLSTAALVLSVSASIAAPISGVSIAGVSSEYTGFSTDRVAAHLVDGSGLTAGLHGNNPNSTMWETDGASSSQFVTFALGANYSLASMAIWNYNEGNVVDLTIIGAQSLRWAVSLDGTTWTSLTNINLTQANGGAEPAQSFNLGGVSANFVRFDNLLSFNNETNVVGLSEVQFTAVARSEVPEPASLALLGLGVAGMAAMRRRRASLAA